ncbi:MAG: binding domain of 6-phosphogluconate dehydrogenase [Pseudomonadota bacterium]|jgi:prephenate dehydrogenase
MAWLESMGDCSPREGARPRVAIIGFGRRGRSLARSLLGRGFRVAAFDSAFQRPHSQPAQFLRRIPVIEHASIPGVVADCSLVVVATPAGAAVEVARAACDHLEPGVRYIDATGAAGPAVGKVSRALAGTGCVLLDSVPMAAASGWLLMREAALLFRVPALESDGGAIRPARTMPSAKLSIVRPLALIPAVQMPAGLPREVAA